MGNSAAKAGASPTTPSSSAAPSPSPSPSKQLAANPPRRDDDQHPPSPSRRDPSACKKQGQLPTPASAASEHLPARRTGAPDCFYYVKSRSCRFGANCKFNHPPSKPPAGEKQREEEEEEHPVRPGEPDCAHYVRFGSCKFGMNCRYNHPPRRKNSVGDGGIGGDQASPSKYSQNLPRNACKYNNNNNINGERSAQVDQLKLNFLGLPLRPGTRVCSYYMRSGLCKFGSYCKFHHPEPESGHANGGASRHAIQGSSQLNSSSGPDKKTLKQQPVPFLAPSPSYTRSGIVPPQEVHPCPEQSGYQINKNKQAKPEWDPFATKVFCHICAEEVIAGNRPTDHLNDIGYNNLCIRFNEKTKRGYNHEQLKRKWEELRKDYQIWKALTGSEPSLAWNQKSNAIYACPEWWAKKKEAMPDCGKFRFAPLENVDVLNIMFGDIMDSTSTVPEANLVNITVGSEQCSCDANDIGIVDKGVDKQSEETVLQYNKEPDSMKPKTNLVHAAFNHLVNFAEKVNPINSTTSGKIDQVGCSISEIMELVADAGAGEGSDEHFIATQLFIKPEYREMFLTLKTPQLRLAWLKRICQEKEK